MRALTGAPAAPHAGRPRQADRARRTGEIVNCAARLFIAHGFQHVSLVAIAREAHVAVRTIYVKFGGKPGLFSAVLQAQRDAVFVDMPPMALDGRPLDEVLCDFAERYLQLVTSERALALLRMVVSEAPGNPELCQSFMLAGPGRTREKLLDFFALPEVSAQLHPGCTADALSEHLVTCLLGDYLLDFLLTGTVRQFPLPAATIRSAVGLFLAGCRRRAAPADH